MKRRRIENHRMAKGKRMMSVVIYILMPRKLEYAARTFDVGSCCRRRKGHADLGGDAMPDFCQTCRPMEDSHWTGDGDKRENALLLVQGARGVIKCRHSTQPYNTKSL